MVTTEILQSGKEDVCPLYKKIKLLDDSSHLSRISDIKIWCLSKIILVPKYWD